jgi:hypothetical protein
MKPSRWKGKKGSGPGTELNDELKLSQLAEGNLEGRERKERDPKDLSCAPYHLLNATLNVGSDPDADLRGRKGSFFIFSKRYIGGEQTGWCPTTKMEACDSHLNLGTAMAISAAAASPNMGAFTLRPFSLLMTLLNVRLGYWLPNPRLVDESVDESGPERDSKSVSKMGLGWKFWRPGPMYLLKEALGTFDTRGRYVNVSDGGHIENLGVYELLRRRCRFIIAVDGEADPEVRCGSLTTLMRFAKIDLGVTLDLDPKKIREGDGPIKDHWVVGTIDYGGGEKGTLLYLKSSLTGDESPDVLAYHANNPAFPHESTADQFFSEAQLEVYRALGEHITQGVFKEAEGRKLVDQMEGKKRVDPLETGGVSQEVLATRVA